MREHCVQKSTYCGPSAAWPRKRPGHDLVLVATTTHHGLFTSASERWEGAWTLVGIRILPLIPLSRRHGAGANAQGECREGADVMRASVVVAGTNVWRLPGCVLKRRQSFSGVPCHDTSPPRAQACAGVDGPLQAPLGPCSYPWALAYAQTPAASRARSAAAPRPATAEHAQGGGASAAAAGHRTRLPASPTQPPITKSSL